MYRYRLQARTYFVLTLFTVLSSFVLILALVQTPVADPVTVGDPEAPRIVPGEPGEFFVEYRAPLITVSAVSIIGLVGAMAFSGGVKYIDRKNVMESPLRRSMYNYIRENPGAYLREISRALDINPTNTTWHLRKLAEAEYVRSQMSNGLKLYYPIEGGIKSKNDAVSGAILKNENARTIVAYLLAHPGGHQREMARAIGVNHGTVRWHLKKLVGAGFVNEHADGSAYKYYISQEGMEFLSNSGEMSAIEGAAPQPVAPGQEEKQLSATDPESGADEPAGHTARESSEDDDSQSLPFM